MFQFPLFDDKDIEPTYLNSAQRKEILRWVGRIGYKMGNGYAKVHIGLRYRYRVKSYRYILAKQFKNVLQFLKDWDSRL